MPGLKNFIPQGIPAPVLTAVISVIATRLFNLLMLLLLLQSDTGNCPGELHRLSLLPDYRLLFILTGMVFVFDAVAVLMLLRGSNRGRTLFICCQCLTILLIVCCLPGGSLAGIDPADRQNFAWHSLLQKIPDLLVIMMLYLPASSRMFFRRTSAPESGDGPKGNK